MAHAWHHARSSARRFGGVPDDYLAVHGWFDQTKSHWADARHRAVLHSSFGIFLCEQFFGPTFKRASDGQHVPTRLVGEQHVLEDLGRIPSVQDWLGDLPLQGWMLQNAAPLSRLNMDTAGPLEDELPGNGERPD
ncbi:DUF6915 family protein [Deinococcus marmoris]|uniref:DUF6915 family protein n=1 Tax=Deinococcus marmoris TaxID=249408 RepID=UPI000498154D|nr:hypothetical protein [Deinococcus marmoris]